MTHGSRGSGVVQDRSGSEGAGGSGPGRTTGGACGPSFLSPVPPILQPRTQPTPHSSTRDGPTSTGRPGRRRSRRPSTSEPFEGPGRPRRGPDGSGTRVRRHGRGVVCDRRGGVRVDGEHPGGPPGPLYTCSGVRVWSLGFGPQWGEGVKDRFPDLVRELGKG